MEAVVLMPGEGERIGGPSSVTIKATGDGTAGSLYLVGDRTVELPPGGFACVPPGVVHTFANTGDAPVRVLNFNTPAGWEHDMRDLAAVLSSGDPTPEAIGTVASRYDFRPA